MRINLYSDGLYDIAGELGWEDDEPRYGDGEELDFLWQTDKGDLISPKDMATPHLINAVNMVWRNLFEIKEDRPEIRNDWSRAYIRRALEKLTSELQERANVELHYEP
jgi:hypothetical protein